MEQYSTEGQELALHTVKVSPDTKHIQSLESKIATLESFVHDQGADILRLRRDISRLKADIEQLTNVLRRG